MNIENSQLKIILSVSKEKNFSGAAKRLNITPSAVSQSIANIEKKIGFKLFHRQGNQMVTTEQGQNVVSFASQHLMKMKIFFERLGRSKEDIFGDISIGTFFGIGKSWLANLSIDIMKKYPELNLNINLSTLDQLIKSFQQNEINMLVLPEESITFPFDKKVCVGVETLVLVYPKMKNFNISSDMSLDDFSEIPTILFEKENDNLFYKWCKSVYKKYPQKINKRFVINSHGNILHAVSEGLGIAVVPKHVLDRSFYKKNVQYLSDKIIKSGKVYLLYKNEDMLFKRNQIVVKEIQKYYNHAKT